MTPESYFETTPEPTEEQHKPGDTKPSILDDPDRIGGENWMRRRLADVQAAAKATEHEDNRPEAVLPMIADFLSGDIAELTACLAGDTVTPEQKNRMETVRALLQVAAWHLAAPDLPRTRAIVVDHETDSVKQVAEYAALHGTTTYSNAPWQCNVGETLKVGDVYTPVTVWFDHRKDEAL